MSNLYGLNQNIDTHSLAKLFATQNKAFNSIDFSSLLKSADETSRSLSKLAYKLSVLQDSYLNSYTFKKANELSQSLAKAQINFLNSDYYSKLVKNFASIQKSLHNNQIYFDNYLSQYKQFISSIANNLSSYEVQINDTVEHLIQTVINQIESDHSLNDQSLSEPMSNIVEISTVLAVSEDLKDEKRLIEKLIDLFSLQIVNAPQSSEAIRSYINHFFIIFVLALQIQLDNAAQSELFRKMEYQQAVLFSKMDIQHAIVMDRLSEIENQLPKQENIYNQYLNKKQAISLIDKPSFKKGHTICQIYPGQRVRIVENKGEWIKVEFFNFILNHHQSGWHKKKYFKKIDN